MNILNFAHGQMFMIGGFAVYYVYGQYRLPFVIGLMVAAIGVGLVGVLFEMLLFRRVRRSARREENSILLAVGTALLLENIALFAFGEKERGVPDVVMAFCTSATSLCPRGGFLFWCSVALIGALLLFRPEHPDRPGDARYRSGPRSDAAHGRRCEPHIHAIGFGIGAGLAGLAGALLVTLSGVNSGSRDHDHDQGLHHDHDRRRRRRGGVDPRAP